MKTILYLGLEVPDDLADSNVIHCPLITITPRSMQEPEIAQMFTELSAFTHLIFTSKSAVTFFMDYAAARGLENTLKDKCIIAVGQKTSAKLHSYGITASHIANNETAEGVIEVLETLDLSHAYLLWPHSSLSRPLLIDWMTSQNIRYRDCILYDTIPIRPAPLPDLELCDEIVFTSSSTVDAFLEAYGRIPQNKKLTCIGPVTEKYLSSHIEMLLSTLTERPHKSC